MQRCPRLFPLSLVLAGCAGDPPRVASLELAGSWRNDAGSALSLEDTGVLLLRRGDPRLRPIVGEYTFDGLVATFRFRPESAVCSDEVGTYEVHVSPAMFDVEVSRDACEERQRLLQGRWERTGEARVTPGS
ncbi:MAG: hypothetical protein RLZZ558_438 [Planctomycetota bacterium]